MASGGNRLGALAGLCVCLWACQSTPAAEPPPAPAPAREPATTELAADEVLGDDAERAIYVPAYSHVFAVKSRRIMLSVTLSVRNVDASHSVVLRYVDYYDTPGHRVRGYLDRPRKLRPLGTAEFSVDVLDDAGGSGANFLIGWQAPEGTQPLLAEAIMLGDTGTGAIAFTSRGIGLDAAPAHPPEPAASPAPTPSAAP